MDLSFYEPQLNNTSWIGKSHKNKNNKTNWDNNKNWDNNWKHISNNNNNNSNNNINNNNKSNLDFNNNNINNKNSSKNISNIIIEDNNKSNNQSKSNDTINNHYNQNKTTYKIEEIQLNPIHNSNLKTKRQNSNTTLLHSLKHRIKLIFENLFQRLSQMSAKRSYLPSFRSNNTGTIFSSKATTGFGLSNLHWLLPRTLQRRLLLKNGDYNIASVHIEKRSRHYLADLFTTLIDLQWRVDLLIFAATFTTSWLFFAFVWWFISFIHDDFENKDKPGWEPCLREVHDFRSALLLSIETQQTIGYGFRNVTTNCSVAVIAIMLQSCFGLIIQALMTGLIFAKLSRPKKRAQTLMFSQKAVICKRDNKLCLLFRIADMRKSQIVEAHVRAFMVSKKVTLEGEVISFHQHNLRLDTSDEEGRLFLAWPSTVEHKINENSPLWDISATDLIHRHFEIVVIMEGIVESTGMTTQARTSYLPAEILWGHRFDPVVSFKVERGQYVVDFAKLNSTTPFNISGLSAKQRDEKTLSEVDDAHKCTEIDSETARRHSDKNVCDQDAKKCHRNEERCDHKKERCCQNVKLRVLEEKWGRNNSGKSSLNTSNSGYETKNSTRDDSALPKMVASHVATTAFNVIGVTSLMPTNENVNTDS